MTSYLKDGVQTQTQHDRPEEGVSIEELPADELYDADVEVIQPDQYEDYDSEQERFSYHEHRPRETSRPSSLMEKMRSLSCSEDGRVSHIRSASKSHKRCSRAISSDQFNLGDLAMSIEAAGSPNEPPRKRVTLRPKRRTVPRSKKSEPDTHRLRQPWTEMREQESNSTAAFASSEASALSTPGPPDISHDDMELD